MGPNSAQAVRIFTREKGGAVADITLEKAKDFQVVVQAEAGSAALTLGLQYQIGLLIRDLSNGTTIPATLAAATPATGQIGKPEWLNAANEFVFDVVSADLATRGGHFIKADAFLLIGLSNFDASSVSSDVALVLP